MIHPKKSLPTVTQPPLFDSKDDPSPLPPGKNENAPGPKEPGDLRPSNPPVGSSQGKLSAKEAREAFYRDTNPSPSTRSPKQVSKKSKRSHLPQWMLNPRNLLAKGLLPFLHSYLDSKALEAMLPGWKKAAEFPQAGFVDFEAVDEVFIPLILRPLLDRDLENLAFQAFVHRFNLLPPSEVSGVEFLRFLAQTGDVDTLHRFLPGQRRRFYCIST